MALTASSISEPMSNLLLPRHVKVADPSLSSHASVRTGSLFRTVLQTLDRISSLTYFPDAVDPDGRLLQQQVDARQRAICARMASAESRMVWEAAAHELDILEGNSVWKADDTTPVARVAGEKDYNPQLIAERLHDLNEARALGDVDAMMRVVRTCLSRDLGGVGNAYLYRRCHVGTKRLVERYVESSLQTINAIVHLATAGSQTTCTDPSQMQAQAHLNTTPILTTPDSATIVLPPHDLLDQLLYARQTFGRSALLLSGGGTFGMAHIGVVKSLFEASLLPRIISGASAGSIVCAVLSTRTDAEIPTLIRDFPYGDLSVFGETSPNMCESFLGHLRLLLTQGTWSDIRHLSRVMRDMIGDITFQEAYNRTRRILNICVSSASVYELPRLLNYVTAPNVMIWSAVAASCSLPLVFGAAPLLAKDPNTGAHRHWDPTPQCSWIDGSVDNDLPMTRLSEMFNVNHFIVSQVNPHVAPFLPRDDGNVDPNHVVSARPPASASEWKGALTSLARDEVMHRLHILSEMGIFPNVMTKLRSMLSQRYSGDINILPELTLGDLPLILSNPTPDFMLRVCLSGERATWPKLSRIHDRCALELALDRAVHRVRAHLLFASTQANLCKLVLSPYAASLAGSARDEQQMFAPTCQKPRHSRQRHRRSSGSRHVTGTIITVEDEHSTRNDGDDDEATTLDQDSGEETSQAAMMHNHHGASSTIHGTPARHRHKVRLKRAFRSHINIGRLHDDNARLAPITAPIHAAHEAMEQGREFRFDSPATLQPSYSASGGSPSPSTVSPSVVHSPPNGQSQNVPSPSILFKDVQPDSMDGGLFEPPLKRYSSKTSFGEFVPAVFHCEDVTQKLGHRSVSKKSLLN